MAPASMIVCQFVEHALQNPEREPVRSHLIQLLAVVQLTHIHNPARLVEGDVVCVVPNFHASRDRMGEPVCPKKKS
jgi:hypothetical protein